jgi:hypothetical protein
MFPAQEIFVLLLEHFESDEQAMVEATRCLNSWTELDRIIRLQGVPIPERMRGQQDFDAQMKRDRELKLPFRDLPNTPKLIPFYPSEKTIGRFFDGTLRFDAEYSKTVRELGYRDTLATIDRCGLRLPAGGSLVSSEMDLRSAETL